MTLQNYLLFVGASLMLCLVPGPDMLLLLSRTIAQGRRAGVATAVGINVGGYVHLTAAILGLSAIVATSAAAFTALKTVGAVYLVYLGVRALLRPRRILSSSPSDVGPGDLTTCFWQGFLSDVLNPKVALFFLALLPQFVEVHAPHPTAQLLLLGLTVNVLAIIFNLGLVLSAARISGAIRSHPTVGGWLERMMGLVFVGLGVRLAVQRR